MLWCQSVEQQRGVILLSPFRREKTFVVCQCTFDCTSEIIVQSIGCYEMTLVKGEIACQKQIFEQGHVRRAETIRIPALATLLYVDWLPQVNGPPGALLSSVVDHESAIIVNT